MEEHFNRFLGEAPAGKEFVTSFGRIKTISELKTHIEEKGESFYKEYVNDNENHFANWIEGVFGDYLLAHSLRSIKNYEDAIKAIDMRLKYAELWLNYNKKLKINLYSNIGQDFNPSFHRFETLNEFTPKQISPEYLKSNQIPKEIISSKVIAHNNNMNIQTKNEETKKLDEQELLKKLEETYPGIKVTNVPKPKSRAFGILSIFFKPK